MSEEKKTRSEEVRTYCPVSKGAFAAMRTELVSEGVTLPDTPSGSVLGPHGLLFSWHHEDVPPTRGQPWLRITIQGDAWKLGYAWPALEAHIKKYVGAAALQIKI